MVPSDAPCSTGHRIEQRLGGYDLFEPEPGCHHENDHADRDRHAFQQSHTISFWPLQEKPIHRPEAATVNQVASEARATRYRVTGRTASGDAPRSGRRMA